MMAKVELSCVQRFKDRHGKWRHYYRRKGCKSVALPGAPGSIEFMEAYAKAEGSGREVLRVQAQSDDRSISTLIRAYYNTADFASLKLSTQSNYRNILDRFRDEHGPKSAVAIKTRHLDAIFEGYAKSFPGAARNLRRRLNRVFRLAVKLGWRSDNPVRETDAPKTTGDGFVAWSEDEIQQFNRYWPEGSRERLAMGLLLYTGQRRSDVVTMGRQHVKDGRISVVQFKGGKRIEIPIHPRLHIAISDQNGMTFLLTQYGRPFSHAGFTQWFVERARMAGISGRTPHGLRKAAGRRLAEAGCSAKQIAAVLGHSTLKQVELYTRDADQKKLADGAFLALEEAENGTKCQT